MLRLELDALMSDSSPEEHEGLAVEFATFSRQRIQLCGLADMYTSYLIAAHRPLFFLSTAKVVNASPSPLKRFGLKRAKAACLSYAQVLPRHY
jgi:hypothetical protein